MFYAATQSGGSSFTPFLLIVAFVVVIYFVLLRPNRRRQQASRQAHQDMLNNLSEGTKIVTIGGLHGTIVGSDAESVTLEISPGVTARYDRAAIAKVAPDNVDDTMSSDGVTYDDDDDIVDGADLDATHADSDSDSNEPGAASASPDSAPTDGTEAPRSSADKND